MNGPLTILSFAFLLWRPLAPRAEPSGQEHGGTRAEPQWNSLEEEILKNLAKKNRPPPPVQQAQQQTDVDEIVKLRPLPPEGFRPELPQPQQHQHQQQQQQQQQSQQELTQRQSETKPGLETQNPQQEPEQKHQSSQTDEAPFQVQLEYPDEEETLRQEQERYLHRQSQQQKQPVKQHQPSRPKYKKEGEEEYPTFVNPNFGVPAARQQEKLMVEAKRAQEQQDNNVSRDLGDTVFLAVTVVCSAAAVFGLAAAGVCWYRLHKQYKAAQEAEYPQYGVTGPVKQRSPNSQLSPMAAMDDKLASTAHLYHYQHTKQQILAMEAAGCPAENKAAHESEESDGEGDEGDFSVYECPGLAPTGDIEVSNPLFENHQAVATSTPMAKKE